MIFDSHIRSGTTKNVRHVVRVCIQILIRDLTSFWLIYDPLNFAPFITSSVAKLTAIGIDPHCGLWATIPTINLSQLSTNSFVRSFFYICIVRSSVCDRYGDLEMVHFDKK